ncbi:OmpP1/FadL family transporter [Luteimonas arsenica]|uniref:OmpP1/FadL family transporter n=1 Tax=Luteimonas arsenica TaxID=1586242 RepID=UPI0014053A63|nr:outer membrane protein transport protein [Luteimonas arsenica]
MRISPILPASALALGILGALALVPAHASGFQLKENSVKGLGAAFAGSGVNEGDASVVVNNPASMTRFEGTTVQADLSVIDLSYEFKGSGTDAFGRPLTGGDGGNAGDVTPVPAFSVIHKLDNGLALGAMVSAPFGLKTEYEPDWQGRYFADTSDVKIVNLTFSAALDITERVSVGVGAVYSKADVTLSKAIDFGTLLYSNPATRPLPFAIPQARDGHASVEGDDTGFGWIAGITFRPTDRFSLGISHQSEIDYDLRGNVEWQVPGDVRAVFNSSPMTAQLFQNGGAGARLTTPSTTAIVARYDITDRFAMMANWTKTGWSSLEEVRIEFDGPDADSVEPFEWQDTDFVSLGGEFKLNEAWTLRGGLAIDETPTSLAHRTPRLPDDDRRWYTLGATWQVSDALSMDFAFARLEPKDPKVDYSSGGSTITGPFDGHANLFGVSAQYRF